MFSSLTEPHYPSVALGIEADGLTVVALDGRKGQFTIRQAASLDLAPGVVNPSFVDVNIADDGEFARSLREVVEIAGLMKQKRWSVAVPSSTARTAILTLDSEPANTKEAEDVLDWKAEQTFGVPAIELRIARQKIAPDKDGRSRYFATAVKLAIIDEYETHFENLGWKAGLILPRAVGEANWLIDKAEDSDALLISGNNDGFTAMILRGSEPAVVRSVTCDAAEIDDEIYRLVMFYHDRFAATPSGGLLQRLLVVGKNLVPAGVQKIAAEALGQNLRVLSADDLGLTLPGNQLNFNDLAAPAGLAALGT